jgi:DNA-binding transcriptional MerR regulator
MIDLDNLTDKKYYSIGEVAKMFNVSASTIRYWENQFSHLSPRKNSKGERRYNKSDIHKIQEIFELTKEKGFTLNGAKSFLVERPDKKHKEIQQKLENLKSLLINLRNQL